MCFSLQIQLLKEHRNGASFSDEVPLITVKDFETYHHQLRYMEGKLRLDHDSIERDSKRQKISQDRAMASYTQDWPFNIGVPPVGQQHSTSPIVNYPLKQEIPSLTNYCNSDFLPTSSNMFSYDLNYNNNSSDWLNAGCSKFIHNESKSLNTSIAGWPQNSLYLQQATTVVEAAWSYANQSFY